MYHLRRIKTMMLLLLVCVVAKAQPEDGKVYRFVNKAHPEQSLAAVSATRSSISATADHYLQYWLLETHPGNASAWTLRNLGNGMYLQHAGTSTPWSFVNTASSATQLYYAEEGGYCTFNSADTISGWACMHYGAGPGCIVGWEFAGEATQWTMTEVSSVTSEQLAQNWADLTEYYAAQDENAIKDCASALDALFADTACTTLETTYASMLVSAIQEDANYKALPAALQELVLKVRNGVWTEANYVDGKAEWESEQAKKFRVQLYEPHSIAGDITSWLGINAHNNMDNPTGIFASYRDVVYVMVEGTIKEGASLYLYGLRGHGQMGSYNDGNAVQLHEGLNAVPYISDGNALWINYVVDTYNANGETDAERFPHKLSEYEPLKINIVGGYINGYYNAVGDALWGAPDDDTDWAYYKDRASLESFTLLSHRVTMQFYMYTTNGSPGLYDLLDNIEVPKKPYCFSGTMGTPATFSQYEGMGLDASTGTINIMLEAWNRIAYSEFATLGVLDAATIDKMNEKYPRWYNNWTERGKIYDYTIGNDGKSYQEYCGGVDYSEYFNHHCLAISNTTGYMSGGWQSSNYNINTAESIIDKIANEAGPTWGPAHEIGHQHQSLFTLNGLTEVTNNLHSNVAVWYMGMGTSRVNGTSGSLASVLEAFNTEGSDYYTNNIWALTQMYYRLWLYYHLAGNNTQFYPRLMENLRREPLEKGYNVGPGGLLRFYKHCCVAAGEDLTEFFRAHGMLSVMTDRLVGDYSNSVYNQSQEQIDAAIAEVKELGLPENIAPLFISDATPDVTYGHDGTTQRSYWDGESTTSGNNAEVGSYIDFVNGETVGTAPTLTIESTTVTIDGLDGVGIAIFNEKGEIVGFSTKSTFELSEECAALLASGEATVKAVNADNSTVAIEVTDPTQIQYDLLGSLLEEANSMLALSDATNTKPGFYKLSALDALKDAYSVAKNVYDEREVNSYSAAYEILKLACDELENNADAIIAIKAGYTYWLENRQTAGKYIAVNDSKALIGSSYSEDDTKQQWVFEAAGEEDIYYIKNVSTQTYLGDLANEQQISATADKEGAIGYRAISLGNGLWALQCQNTAAKALNYYTWNGNNQIIGWDYEGEKPGSHWYLTAVGLDDNVENLYALQDLIEDTEALIDEMGSVTEGTSTPITLTENSYYCNARCLKTQWDIFSSYDVLCDGKTDTYLHTDYSGDDSEDGLDHYIRIDVGESNSVKMFKFNYTNRTYDYHICPTEIKIEGSNDLENWYVIEESWTKDLPTGSGATYASPMMGTGMSYRYIRLMVKKINTANAPAGPEGNKHVYFAMAELGISKVDSYTANLNDEYTSVDSEILASAFDALLDAKGVVLAANTVEYKSAYTVLQEKYKALLDAREDVANAALNAKKAELQTLINNTTSLISSCGTVTYTPATYSGTPKLQTSDSNADFYVWTNAQEADEGPIADLVDGNNNTFFHSDYSGANSTDGLDHHITINLGEGNEVSSFTFGYVTRHNADANYPETIEVYGSENCTDYELLTTVSGLPSGNTQTYNSGEAVVASKYYSNLRFMVTATNNNNEKGGHPIFHMAEFTLTAIGTPESYTVELGNNAGGATNALMLAAYKENASAQATHTLATTLSQVEEAIAKLQADYDALKSAKESAVYVTYYVQVVGGDANGGVVYGGNSYMSSASFEAPINLTVADLTAISLDGYAEPVVTLNGTTITVTYNKIYSVQVTGGGGNGGVTYNEQNYVDGATFDAQQSSFTKEDLTAIVPEGYTLKEVTVNHETGVISVSYAAIPLVDSEKYYTLECKSSAAHSTERFIGDNGSIIDGRSAEGTRFLFERADDENGYYMKSMISGKYLNHDANNNLYASADRVTVWTIAKTSFESLNYPFTLTVGNNLYLNNHDITDCADGSCVDLRSNLHENGVGSNNACSLWTLVAYDEPYDKTELNTLLGEVKGLVASCYTDEVFNYTGSIYVTEALMTATDEKVSAAQTAYDDKTTAKVVYDAALEALQTAKTNLQYAIDRAWLPVILTTDIEAPVLYTIKSKRGNTKVLQYEPASDHMFSVADVAANSAKQAFFFMESDEATQVYVYPFAAGEQVLSADDTGDGADRAFAKEKGTAAYEKWMFVKRTVDEATWYNLQPVGTSTYFSNYGGVSNKMGFYSSNPEEDGGSLFQFESTTVEGSGAYNSLKVYYDEVTKGANIVGGDNPGYYPAVQAEAYNEAYASATALLNPQAITLGRRLTAEELSTSTVARTIAIKCVQESSYEKWVSKAAGLSSTLDADAVFSLEPADDGKGTYYLKVVNQVDGYFQTSGYSLGAKSGAQDFVPVKAVYQGGSGNTAFGGSNADVSGNSDLDNLVRFVLGSSDGTTFLNPGFTAYNTGTGVWTVYNVYEVFYNWVPAYNDYLAAYQVLLAANNALVMNMPEEGKYYTIVSACGDHRNGQLMYATSENAIVFSSEMTNVKPEALWKFTAEGYLENLQTGCGVSTGSTGGSHHKLGESPRVVSIKSISLDGQVLLTPQDAQPLHAQDNGSVVVGWGAYDAGSASAWRIVEVEDMSLVNFTLKIGQYRHAGLYLNYAAEIPEGVEVYIAHTPDGEAGTIFADKLDDTVLPARTAVIVKGDEGEYTFKYTTGENTADIDKVDANLLGGSAYLKYQQVASEGNLCCVFGQKGGEVGLYKNWVGYADVNGTAAEDTNGDGKVNEDGGTHFKVSANKIYYEYEPSAVAGASAFRFRFNSNDEETTTIDNLQLTEDAVIYNLYGQRIVKIAEPGIYIVNGKKIYVSDKMILNND